MRVTDSIEEDQRLYGVEKIKEAVINSTNGNDHGYVQPIYRITIVRFNNVVIKVTYQALVTVPVPMVHVVVYEDVPVMRVASKDVVRNVREDRMLVRRIIAN